MMSIPLLLMGCGGVGRQLLHHIISCRPLHYRQGVRLKIVGVCDSKSMVAIPDVLTSEFHDEFLLQLCDVKSRGSSLQELVNIGNPISFSDGFFVTNEGEYQLFSGEEIGRRVINIGNPISFSDGFFVTNEGEYQLFSGEEIGRRVIDVAASLHKSSGLTLVDCSASSETVSLLSEVLNLDGCVVLANKKPLTASLEYYDKLISQPRRIRHESTVGAGLPVISTINRLISSGDPIFRIIGSLSGTLGYVMSEVEGGRPFSQVVNAAKSLGFTEPDPRDDLSGMDVARKALILARLLGRRIELDNITVESLYPVEMGPDVMPLEDFLLHGLPSLDKDIQKRIKSASSNGNVLRYVCLIEESRCEVGIQEVAKDSALGRLKGSDNVLEIYSRCYKKQPLVIQGAGAGNDTTAAGVLADILDLRDLFRH